MPLPHIFSAAFFGAPLLVASFPIFAHHAFPTFFDPREIVSVEGFLTGVRLINPHSYFRVQVTEPNGQTGDWVFESSPVASLSKAGWHSDSIPASAKVRMSGFAARNGRPIARWRSILVYGQAAEDDARRIFGQGQPPDREWRSRVEELGVQCEDIQGGCFILDAATLDILQREFTDIGVWSPLE